MIGGVSQDQPYQGIKVLDVSQGFAGPYCAALFALYGAEVIKVEPPEGDWIRQIGQAYGDHTPLGIIANRGKKCLALDLKKDGAVELLLELARDCDIFIESSRPGVADRLHIGYEDIRKVNPNVLYVSVSGFGQAGPNAGRPATDTVMQAFSGIVSVNEGMDGVPHRIGMLIVDTSAGVYTFQAVQAALYARRESGEGRYLDINLMQSTAAFLAPKIVEYHLTDGNPRILNAPTGSFQTKDGWLAVAIIREPKYVHMCELIGRPDLARDPRFDSFEKRAENTAALLPELRKTFAEETSAVWAEKLQAAEILCSPVNDFGDWLADPHVREVGKVTLLDQPDAGTIPVPDVPGTTAPEGGEAPLVAPAIGEHGREILAGLGIEDAEIARLAEAGTVRFPD